MTEPKSVVHLPQIQGLRALAIVAVIGFHLSPAAVPGGFIGVDIFFVVSGYLITGHLARSLASEGRFSAVEFWARRARRLLPMALLVLVASIGMTVAFIPDTEWARTSREVIAAAFYVSNWVQAADAVDYFAAEESATVVQHYWSLSVEEQYYFAWPIVLAAAAWMARRRGRDLQRTLVRVTATVVLVSFAHAVVTVAAEPSRAHFSTFTHAWEFAAGGLAFVATSGRLAKMRGRSVARTAVVAVAVAVIVASSLVLDGGSGVPGWAAIAPVAATLAVILAGAPRLVERVCATPPVRVTGDLSYGAYLWHWPLLVVAPFALDRILTRTDRIGVGVAAFALAGISKVLIEDPVRFRAGLSGRRPGLQLIGGLVCCALVVGAALQVDAAVDRRRAARAGEFAALNEGILAGRAQCFAAFAMLDPASCGDHHRIDPDLAAFSATHAADAGVPVDLHPELRAVRYGPEAGAIRVALIGDSHAGMYFAAFQALADAHGWTVFLLREDDCSPSAPTWRSAVFDGDNTAKCLDFRQRVQTFLPEVDLDLIVTSSVAPRYSLRETAELQAVVADALEEMWTAWTDAGIPVAVIADVPGPGAGGHDCLAANLERRDPCVRAPDEVIERDPMLVAAERHPSPLVSLIDLTPAYCDDVCHMVVGGTPVYISGAHISSAFSLSLLPWLEPAILPLLRTAR